MSIKNLLFASAAAAVFAACSDYDPGLSEKAQNYTDSELQTLEEYAINFANRYGTPDPEHTWGFGEVEAEQETRAIRVNTNEWFTRQLVDWYDDENQYHKEYVWAVNLQYLPEGAEIPGFPSVVDGKYHTTEAVWNESKQQWTTKFVEYDSVEEIEAAGKTNVIPVGDVTEEEILQVSKWFRTHRYPTSDPFEATSIFFQEISHDVDRVIADPAAKQSLIEAAYDEALWDTDFDTEDDNGQINTCGYKMDYLCVKAASADWEHTNNFNATEINNISELEPNSADQDLSGRKIQFWTTNGGTAVDFAFHCSEDNTDHNEHWVVKKVPYTINGKTYESYYLAFDYEADKSGFGGGKVIADGFYSNWIVKLTKGTEVTTTTTEKPEPEHQWHRIMCEDLGNTDDFDFNDLVFDVYYSTNAETGKTYANIIVRAAGGTLPIYLGGQTEADEVHQLFDQAPASLYTPVNVGAGETKSPIPLTLEVTSTEPNDIPIYVGKQASEDAKTTILLPKAGSDANTSAAPQKICIPGNTTRWLRERQQIESAYPHFPDWVKKDKGDYGYDSATPWNTTDVNPGTLY